MLLCRRRPCSGLANDPAGDTNLHALWRYRGDAVAVLGSHELLQSDIQERTAKGGGICIGKAVESVTIAVIKISDEVIEEWSDELKIATGQVGEIVVKGKNVTSAYFRRQHATDLAKIKDGVGFWHRMGDLGYLDKEGRLWFCGRKTQRVQLSDKELYTIQCESIFNNHPQIHRTALVAVGQQPVLCVEIDQTVANPNQEQIRQELLAMAAANPLTVDIRTLFFHPSFPVDIRHNAKIFREKLAKWVEKQI